MVFVMMSGAYPVGGGFGVPGPPGSLKGHQKRKGKKREKEKKEKEERKEGAKKGKDR